MQTKNGIIGIKKGVLKMEIIKITYSYGYRGCDGHEYVEVADENKANEYVTEDSYWEEITKEEYEENT
jgi:hypothetical protein